MIGSVNHPGEIRNIPNSVNPVVGNNGSIDTSLFDMIEQLATNTGLMTLFTGEITIGVFLLNCFTNMKNHLVHAWDWVKIFFTNSLGRSPSVILDNQVLSMLEPSGGQQVNFDANSYGQNAVVAGRALLEDMSMTQVIEFVNQSDEFSDTWESGENKNLLFDLGEGVLRGLLGGSDGN